jgi:dTMP kinase
MLIVFEGIDGSGKTTVIERLQAHLIDRNIDAIATSEFGNSFPWAKTLRAELMANKSDPIAQYHTVLKARDQHVIDVLTPAAKAGKVILMDRYLMSTLAYQGQSPLTPVRQLLDDHEMFQFPVADLTILLSCNVSTALKRQQAAGKKDAFDTAGWEFFSKAHEIYISCANAVMRQRPGKMVIIDAEQPLDDVLHDVVNAVTGLLMTEAA